MKKRVKVSERVKELTEIAKAAEDILEVGEKKTDWSKYFDKENRRLIGDLAAQVGHALRDLDRIPQCELAIRMQEISKDTITRLCLEDSFWEWRIKCEKKKFELTSQITAIAKQAQISDKFKFRDQLDELANLLNERDELYRLLSILYDAVEP